MKDAYRCRHARGRLRLKKPESVAQFKDLWDRLARPNYLYVPASGNKSFHTPASTSTRESRRHLERTLKYPLNLSIRYTT